MTEQSIPIFVISLAREEGRRQRIKDHLHAIGAHFYLIDAIDGRALTEEILSKCTTKCLTEHDLFEISALNAEASCAGVSRASTEPQLVAGKDVDGRNRSGHHNERAPFECDSNCNSDSDAKGNTFHPGVIGCYLSHIEVYLRMMREDIEVACILEDDARLNPAFLPVLQADLEHSDFDYCFLDCAAHNHDGHVFYDPNTRTELGSGFYMYQTHAAPEGAHAYLITQEAARKRLECAFPIRKPVDVYSHLPVPLRFHAVLFPKAAWVSDDSRRSATSGRHDEGPIRFKWFRRWEVFYEVRDMLKLRPLRLAGEKRRLQRMGTLCRERKWKPLPAGRRIIYC